MAERIDRLGGCQDFEHASGRNGRRVSLSADQLTRGGFVTQMLTTPGQFALPPGQRLNFELEGKPGSLIVPENHSRVLWLEEPASSEGSRSSSCHALAASPILLGNAILVPGTDARAYLVDPVSGQSRAEPFVRRFDRDHQGTWLNPVLLDLDTVRSPTTWVV